MDKNPLADLVLSMRSVMDCFLHMSINCFKPNDTLPLKRQQIIDLLRHFAHLLS
jgi:hypothetical protein